MLDKVVVLQYAHQVGLEEDLEVDSLEVKAELSEDGPQW